MLTRSIVRAARFAAVACLCAVAGGCGEESETARLIRQAEAELVAIGGGETTGADPFARESYAKVVQSLRSLPSGASASDTASASLVLARAHLGLGEGALERAVEADAEQKRRLGAARAHLAAWIDHHAQANSLEAFDPDAEQQEIAAARAERIALLDEAQAERERLSSALERLRAEASSASSEASSIRAQIIAEETALADASATESARRAPRIRELRRRADGLELVSGDRTAQADLIVPELAVVDLQIETLESQLAQLTARRVGLEERQRELAQAATGERRLADQSAEALDTALRAVTELRRDALMPASEEAEQQFRSALSAAQRAGSAMRQESQRSTGAARRRLADTLVVRAAGHEALARLLESAARTEPAPPNAPAYTERAEALRAEQQAFLEEAASSFEQAVDEIGAGADPDEVERLRRVMALLASSARGASVDLDAVRRLANAPVSAGDGFAGDDAGFDPDGPEATLMAIVEAVRADGDDPSALGMGVIAMVVERMRFDQPDLDAMLRSFGSLAFAVSDLDDAMQAEFGVTLTEAAAENPQLNQLTQGALNIETQTPSPSLTMDDVLVDRDGDTARVSVDSPDTGQSFEFTMRRDPVDGEWFIDLSEFVSEDGSAITLGDALAGQPGAPEEIPVAAVAAFGPVVDQIAEAIVETAQGVRGGSLADAQTAVNALVLRVQPIVFRALAEFQAQQAPQQ